MTAKKTPESDSRANEISGRLLLSTRESLGVSQKELAEKIGTTERSIRNYEKGIYPFPFHLRLAMIHHYNVDPMATQKLYSELGWREPIQMDHAPAKKGILMPTWNRKWGTVTDWCAAGVSAFYSNFWRTREGVMQFLVLILSAQYASDYVLMSYAQMLATA